MSVLPTGAQYAIVSGDHRAVVTELGATLRHYSAAGRDLVRGFAADESPKGGRGQQLIPWPNRIRDGRYSYAGVDHQLWLSEPSRHNASHGLVRYAPWQLVTAQPDTVTLGITIFPQPGWPGLLRAELTYRVDSDGLRVELRAENLGAATVPFGYGAHPYLSAGEDLVDELTLTIPAERYLAVDDRLLPAEVRPVAGSDLDWRTGRRVGGDSLDTAFTDLVRGADDRWEIEVSCGERRTVLWGDESMGWAQVFTGGPYRNWSVAVEPMTCGPDAFNPGPTHADLLEIEPGATLAATWGIHER